MVRRISLLVASCFLAAVAVIGLSLAAERGQALGMQDIQDGNPSEQLASLEGAVNWLVETRQNDDGGYTSFSTGANQAPSAVGGTLDAVLALTAAGQNLREPFPGEINTPIGYLLRNWRQVEDYAAADGGQAGKLVLGLAAANEDPRNFAGLDLVEVLLGHLESDGSFGVGDVSKQALAVMALVAAGEPVPPAARQWIVDAQAQNGSWDDGFGTVGNADATALAIMALVSAETPVSDPVLVAARDFLASAQLPDGSWEYGSGFGGNANSTGLVVQALSALGEVWYDDAGSWTKSGTNPLEALLAFQGVSGAFQADFGQGPFDDFFATVQAMPAAAGRPFPLPSRHESVARALVCLQTLQDAQTGGWEQFAGFGLNAAGTARAIEAIASAGGNPQEDLWTTLSGINAVEALAALTPDYLATGRGGPAGVVAQGVVAAGPPYTPDAFAGFDLPLVTSGYLSPTGEYEDTAFGIFGHAEAMLGLIVSGAEVDASAIGFLTSVQGQGDWGSSDQNGIALQVLGLLGEPIPAGALETLRSTQTADGGWGYDTSASSPSSTSEVAQGLAQMGENPFGPGWSVISDGRVSHAADAVMASQAANGCWPNLFGPGDDPFSTTDAIIMLSSGRKTAPISLFLPVVSSGE